MAYNHQDFRVFEFRLTQEPNVERWQVRAGGKRGNPIVTTKNQEEANDVAHNLNLDPWYFDRGQTRADYGYANHGYIDGESGQYTGM